MGLPKGITNNPNGRPKGAENKATGELRELIAQFMQAKFPEVEKEWKRLTPKEKLNFYKDLLKYTLPAMQATQYIPFGEDGIIETTIDFTSA